MQNCKVCGSDQCEICDMRTERDEIHLGEIVVEVWECLNCGQTWEEVEDYSAAADDDAPMKLKLHVPLLPEFDLPLNIAWNALRYSITDAVPYYENNPLMMFWEIGVHLRPFVLDFSTNTFYRRFGNRWNYKRPASKSEPPLPPVWY